MIERRPSRSAQRTFVALAIAIGTASAGAPGLADDATSLEADDDGAYVYSARSQTSRRVGRLGPSSPVRVRTCGDECGAVGGFVSVEPFGFMIGRNLRPRRAAPESRPTVFARISHRTELRARADGSGRLRRMRVGHSIALVQSSIRQAFAERPDGSFVAMADVTIHRPSTLSGERDPRGTLGFFLRDVPLAGGRVARRYERMPVERIDETNVRIAGTDVPRDAVRVARRVERDREVPPNAFWVHVDVDEQVLTAYQGDRWVFATLVTTGSTGYPTVRGTYSIHQKTRAMTMVGDEPNNYLVEGVADVQFFRAGYALHSAYWHDHFGTRGSHGCVNLSPADARFLFDWAPPTVPEGWETIYPQRARVDRLWVTVD